MNYIKKPRIIKAPDYCIKCGLYMNTSKGECKHCKRLKEIMSGLTIEENIPINK